MPRNLDDRLFEDQLRYTLFILHFHVKLNVLICDFVTLTEEATPKEPLLFPLFERDSPPSLPPRMATRLNKT